MKFNHKFLISFFIFIFSISFLITTGFAIYYFGFKTINHQDDSLNDDNVQPTFTQEEINWIVKEKVLIISRFKEILESKKPKIKFTYFVNNVLEPTNIKVSYTFQKEIINWFYELKY